MAKVRFKRGLEADLLSLSLTSADDGTFFLTTDTNRLYVCTTDKLKPVNQGVTTVLRVEDLPDLSDENIAANLAGSFYYIKNVNILCVASGKQWVQINSDTTLDTKNSQLTVTDKTGSVQVDLSIADTSGHAIEGGFTLKAGEGVKLGVKEKEITISGSVEKITIDETGAISLGDTKVQIKPGRHIESIDPDTAQGTLTINAEDMYTSDFSVTPEEEGYKISLTDGSGTKEGTLNPQVHYGSNGLAKIKNNELTLDVYDKTEVDRLIAGTKQEMDAMTYRGTVGEGGTAAETLALLASEQLHIGDTFKVISAEYYKEQLFKVGDLAIAQGTEDESGVIQPETLTFDWVPSSGAAAYVGFVNASAFGLREKQDDGGDADVLNVTLQSGDSNMIEVTGSVEDGKPQATYKFDHKRAFTSTTTGEGKTSNNEDFIIPVDKVTYDDYGHITGVETTKYTVSKVEVPVIQEVNTQITDNEDNSISIDTVVTTDKQSYSTADNEGTIKLKSENFTIKQEEDKSISINLEWGSF